MTGSGGWSPTLVTESDTIGPDIAFLASEDYTVKRVGTMLDSSAVTADANGDKIVPAGSFVTPDALGDKYLVYSGATDEKQTITINGGPTGGTFTLTFAGQTTGPIAFNATGPAVKAALTALSNIGDNDVSVSKSGTVYTVDFTDALDDTDVAQMTATSSLTGGSTPGVAIATVTAGGAAGTPSTLDPDTSGYTFEGVNLKDGDVSTGVLIRGSVLAARVHPSPDATIRAAVRGRIIFQ